MIYVNQIYKKSTSNILNEAKIKRNSNLYQIVSLSANIVHKHIDL